MGKTITNLLISDFWDLKEPAASSHIFLLKFISTANNGGTTAACHTVVVGLPETSDYCDARLYEEMLCKVRDTFLCDDEVGFDGDDVGTDLLDVVLLQLKNAAGTREKRESK